MTLVHRLLNNGALVYRLRNPSGFVAFKMGRRQGGPSRTGSKRAYIFALRTSLFDFFGAYPGFRFAPPQAFIRPRLRRLRASVLGHRQKRNHRETQARQRLVRMGVAAI
jgi:hypothetical protein